MKQFLSIAVFTLMLVLHAQAEKFFWGGTAYEWAMVSVVDEEKKIATVIPNPFDAPDKTIEVPLRYVTKDMLDFYARPELDINGPARKPLRKLLDKYKSIKAVFVCGKIIQRLPDGALLLDCPVLGGDSPGKANVRLTLLAPTKLVEGNLLVTYAAFDPNGPFGSTPDGRKAPPIPYTQIALPAAH